MMMIIMMMMIFIFILILILQTILASAMRVIHKPFAEAAHQDSHSSAH